MRELAGMTVKAGRRQHRLGGGRLGRLGFLRPSRDGQGVDEQDRQGRAEAGGLHASLSNQRSESEAPEFRQVSV